MNIVLGAFLFSFFWGVNFCFMGITSLRIKSFVVSYILSIRVGTIQYDVLRGNSNSPLRTYIIEKEMKIPEI